MVVIYLGYFPAHPLRPGSVFYFLAATIIDRARHILMYSGKLVDNLGELGSHCGGIQIRGTWTIDIHPPQHNVIGEGKGEKEEEYKRKTTRDGKVANNTILDFKQPHQ